METKANPPEAILLESVTGEREIENPQSHPSEPSFTLGGQGQKLMIAWHEAESRWQVSFTCKEGKIVTSVFSGDELLNLFHALGTKKLWPRTETFDEALLRGVGITHCPTMFAFGGGTFQSHYRGRGNLAEGSSLGEITKKPKAKAQWTRAQLAELTLEDIFGKSEGK